MKAIVLTQYGSSEVLKLKDLEKPVAKENEVLVKVHASSINAADKLTMGGTPFIVRMMAGALFSPPKNKVLGADIAGTIEAVGANVQHFNVGDTVFADMSDAGLGGFAEYVAVPETLLVRKPSNLTFEQVASVPLAGVTALQGLRDSGKIEAGQSVLINGASGGVGTFAVQLAKYYGATVTAICSSDKVEMVRGIGADTVIDYKQEDVLQGSETYDLILDIAAYRPATDYKAILNPQGKYVLVGGSISRIFQVMLFGGLYARGSQQTISGLMAKATQDDLAFMGDLLEAGKITPVIDTCYSLEDTAQAMHYFENGQAKGKVVITVGEA